VADRDDVRLLTGLTAGEVSDALVDQWLAFNNGAVRLAAADALEAYASTLGYVASDDVTVDGSKRAAVLLKRAETLRAQHEATDDGAGFFFDVVFDRSCRPELTEPEVW
jgi:hypothetical protein